MDAYEYADCKKFAEKMGIKEDSTPTEWEKYQLNKYLKELRRKSSISEKQDDTVF